MRDATSEPHLPHPIPHSSLIAIVGGVTIRCGNLYCYTTTTRPTVTSPTGIMRLAVSSTAICETYLGLLALIPSASVANPVRTTGMFGLSITSLNSLTLPSVSAHCFAIEKGRTIQGADYRRDYRLPTMKHCANVCQHDENCMAFEWREEKGTCTLKSRSLNGSVIDSPRSDVHFGICLDYGWSEIYRKGVE